MKTKGHANIAIFIPHQGCPHRCSFCNQGTISGKSKAPSPEEVDKTIKTALGHGLKPENTEIAFFGGSFTGLDKEYMTSLLKTAHAYIRLGLVKGIRISTRPDYIDDEILKLLKKYGVSAIELGAQSMFDKALKKIDRGHTAEDVKVASNKIKGHGFDLGLQMMTGLPLDTKESTIKTAKELIKLKPQTVRIYPSLVLKGTKLADLYKKGDYKPQSLDEAVTLCADLLMMFYQTNIKVIRLGLHTSQDLQENMLAGPYHPAFRELCEAQVYYNIALKEIEDKKLKGPLTVQVSPRERSKMLGQKRANVLRLANKGFDIKVIDNIELEKYELIITENKM